MVAVISVGSWLSSRAQPTPIATTTTAGSAVVVSSLACTEGAGGTLVDVLLPSGARVRTSLDACGHREGELLTVGYPVGDPAAAWISGAESSADDSEPANGLLPIGLGVAALLGVCAVLAVWLDGRRTRRDTSNRHAPAAHQEVDTDEVASPVAGFASASVQGDLIALVGEDPELSAGRHALPEPVELTPPAQYSAPAANVVDRRASSADLVFPFTSSLAASLHDELFTHRSVTT